LKRTCHDRCCFLLALFPGDQRPQQHLLQIRWSGWQMVIGCLQGRTHSWCYMLHPLLLFVDCCVVQLSLGGQACAAVRVQAPLEGPVSNYIRRHIAAHTL
jgi:hypothetical protein